MDGLRARDLVIINLEGAVETKIRPAVVLSSDEYHRQHPDIVVGILTTQLAGAHAGSDCVLQDWASSGLLKASAFRSWIVTKPKTEVRKWVGQVSERDWKAVQECVRRALVLD